MSAKVVGRVGRVTHLTLSIELLNCENCPITCTASGLVSDLQLNLLAVLSYVCLSDAVGVSETYAIIRIKQVIVSMYSLLKTK